MAAKVTGVAPGSPADGLIRAGDTLLRIGGEEICDVLDYMYHGAGEELEVELLRGETPPPARPGQRCGSKRSATRIWGWSLPPT